MHKIPVTVVTGFLGSGKTTLVRHLLQNNQGRRIAVLVNEFGEVGIDGDLLRSCQVCDEDETATGSADTNILELANGCLCCTVQEEFFAHHAGIAEAAGPNRLHCDRNIGTGIAETPSAGLSLAGDAHGSDGGWHCHGGGWRGAGEGADGRRFGRSGSPAAG